MLIRDFGRGAMNLLSSSQKISRNRQCKVPKEFKKPAERFDLCPLK
jgi:hypothetical protein